MKKRGRPKGSKNKKPIKKSLELNIAVEDAPEILSSTATMSEASKELEGIIRAEVVRRMNHIREGVIESLESLSDEIMSLIETLQGELEDENKTIS